MRCGSRRWKTQGLAGFATAALLAVLAPAAPAWALAISQAYLLSSWSSPTSSTGAPFGLNGTSGFELTLDSAGVATSAAALSGSLLVQVADRLYYESHTGTIDPNEVAPDSIASRVDSEIARLDDAGLVNESVDAALNIDFTNDSSVTLRPSPNLSVTGLVIFEDAGLDPFSLRYCSDSACTSSDLLFDGFNSATTSALLASGAFGTDDYAPGIDQAFWFVFDQPLAVGYFRIAETQNFGWYRSELLEVDFIGVAAAPARVPEPSTLLLFGSGLLGLPLLRRFPTR